MRPIITPFESYLGQPLKILKVNVRNDEDIDGETILRVDVIFEGPAKNIKSALVVGAVRRVRPKLIEQNETAFPVFAFISKSEIGAKHFEAA
ncbi:MAG: hypothetical protein ACKOBC_11745 [Hyphomicrobiales bacterium]